MHLQEFVPPDGNYMSNLKAQYSGFLRDVYHQLHIFHQSQTRFLNTSQ